MVKNRYLGYLLNLKLSEFRWLNLLNNNSKVFGESFKNSNLLTKLPRFLLYFSRHLQIGELITLSWMVVMPTH